MKVFSSEEETFELLELLVEAIGAIARNKSFLKNVSKFEMVRG